MNEMRPHRIAAAVGIENNKVERRDEESTDIRAQERETTESEAEILRFCHCSLVWFGLSPQFFVPSPCLSGGGVVPKGEACNFEQSLPASTLLHEEEGGRRQRGEQRERERGRGGRWAKLRVFDVYCLYLSPSQPAAASGADHATPRQRCQPRPRQPG